MIKNDIKVSILVPIYNVEKFLEKCLESLVKQTLRGIEIICINDGSTDRSLEIIKQYALQDNRIEILNKPNSGYGDSMNKGLMLAKGEYIGIVESDDFVKIDMFERLYKIAIEKEVDLVKSRYMFYWENKTKHLEWTKNFKIKANNVGRKICPIEHEEVFFIPPSIWSALYKKEFIEKNKIQFLPTPGASYQDVSFAFKTWALAKSIYLTDEEFLYYRQDNVNSSVKNVDKEKIDCLYKEYDEIERFLQNRKILNNQLKRISGTIRLGGFFFVLNNMDKHLRKKYMMEYKKNFKGVDSEKFFYIQYLGMGNRFLLWCARNKCYSGLYIYDTYKVIKNFFQKS